MEPDEIMPNALAGKRGNEIHFAPLVIVFGSLRPIQSEYCNFDDHQPYKERWKVKNGMQVPRAFNTFRWLLSGLVCKKSARPK
jgi:hypothetical protein